MKTVIEMAREAGFTEGELAFMGDNFIRFVELVRADEREACAKLADKVEYRGACESDVARAIRARSNT